MKKRIIVLACASVLAVAAALLVWKFRLIVPTPPRYQAGAGAEYAEKLAEKTQGLSLSLALIGWISVTSGGLLAVAGAVLGSKPLPGMNPTAIAVLASQNGLICAVFAVVLGGIGWQCIDRSTSATKTASIATNAIATATLRPDGEEDKRAYEACVAAKAAWLEGRMSHDRLRTIVESLDKRTRDERARKDSDVRRSPVIPTTIVASSSEGFFGVKSARRPVEGTGKDHP